MGHPPSVTTRSVAGRVRITRAYEPASDSDGYRVLVDRLWPRGVSKEKAHLGVWMREIAPSTALRRWFGHDPARWDEFGHRYQIELAEPERCHLVDALAERATHGPVTLIYGARDVLHNEAVILRTVVIAAHTTAGKGSDR